MSDYVQQNLRPGETVVHRGRMSLVPVLAGGCITLAFSLIVLLGAYAIAASHTAESWYNRAVGATTTKKAAPTPGKLDVLVDIRTLPIWIGIQG